MVYRARRIFLEAESSRKMPDELKGARVALGSDRFAKEALSIQGDLGEITDFEQSRNGELMVVGQNGVVFLNNGNSFQRSFHFQKKCNSDVVLVELGSGAFLCRGGWSESIAVFDTGGKAL